MNNVFCIYAFVQCIYAVCPCCLSSRYQSKTSKSLQITSKIMQTSGSNSRPPETIRRGTQRRRRGTRVSRGPRIRCGFIFVNGCLCATNLAPYAGRGTNFLENISSRSVLLLRDLQFTRFGKILHVSACAGT